MQHGVRRTREEADSKAQTQQTERNARKLAEYRSVLAQFVEMNEKKSFDSTHLESTARLLALNPEMPTAWSARRRVLSKMVDGLNDQEKQALLAADLPLTLQALRHNPKIYSVWEHRKWILKNLPKPSWKYELGLVDKFLEADARNFHGWAYRRHILASDDSCSSTQAEFDFTTSKIMASFSNFSAWQYRANLLEKLIIGMSDSQLATILDSEFELVRQALYTDPADQSGWIYHRLLSSYYPAACKEALLRREIKSISELAELEAGERTSRWPLDALVFYKSEESLLNCDSVAESSREAKEACDELTRIDPDRKHRYQYLAARFQ